MEKLFQYYAPDIVEKLQKVKAIAVFGARVIATEVASVLMGKPYYLSVVCFVVSKIEENPSELLGKPVINIEKAGDVLPKDQLIVIACKEKNLEKIRESLGLAGFFNLLPLTFESDLWCCLRGNYFMEYCSQNHKEYLKLEDELRYVEDWRNPDYGSRENEVCVYSVRCHVDRKLEEDLSCFSWEIPIQAGAELTRERICDIRDNTGKHISAKNREYCELTALYWIWRNTSSPYAGLCHYRRHFQLNTRRISQLAVSDIDVVLTIPILNFPSVGAVYAQDHDLADWQIMMCGIKELCPEYSQAATEVQNGIYYYAYNMFIAKKSILDEYCQWLFPILSYCEKRCERKESAYQNRYIGFLAERLLTIYIRHHESQYKIAHGDKHFVAR